LKDKSRELPTADSFVKTFGLKLEILY